MQSIIQLLPDHVANQIAAGEVVQRPASVVKELIENAVDAGATEIKLIVKDAGKTLIQVIDNGKGMSETDARMCFERHATSKIKAAEDLFALHTKGFRGEALASIAAVAKVSLQTQQSAQDLGTEIVIEGSKIIHQQATVVPQGTSFSVKNLFYNIPARRNFLKSDVVEFRHIVDEFERVALAHPEIHFSLWHNNNDVLNLPISNFRQRIVGVLGTKSNEKLVPIQEKTELITIEGFVGKPEFSKKKRSEQFFFVNNRFIKSPYLQHAVAAAFEGLLKDGFQPSFFLQLQVPTERIDINIHPTKTEIKFEDDQAIYSILRAAIKHGLGQFNIMPLLDFERDETLDLPYQKHQQPAVFPSISLDEAFNPFEMSSVQNPFSNGENFEKTPSYNSKIAPSFKKNKAEWEHLYTGINDIESISIDESNSYQASFFDAQETQQHKYLQFQKKYIISTIKSGLLIIHQQRAHERILFEQFLKNSNNAQPETQTLLFPIQIQFSAQDIFLFKEILPSLEMVGFHFEPSNQLEIIISGLPTLVKPNMAQHIIAEFLLNFQLGIPNATYNPNEECAKILAQKVAVQTGNSIDNALQEQLISQLFACETPHLSPSGKPTYVLHSLQDIDNQF